MTTMDQVEQALIGAQNAIAEFINNRGADTREQSIAKVYSHAAYHIEECNKYLKNGGLTIAHSHIWAAVFIVEGMSKQFEDEGLDEEMNQIVKLVSEAKNLFLQYKRQS